MKILAIETATEACSAALLIDGEVIERFEISPRGHSSLILPMMDGLLAEAGISLSQLDALAFGRGPGSFTGVRIATGVIQGAAFAADLPVVPVSTLAAIAHGVYREGGHTNVLAAIDARMKEVYWGVYRIEDQGAMTLLNPEIVATASEVTIPKGGHWFGAGSAWKAYEEILKTRLGQHLQGIDPEPLPHAHDIAVIGATEYQHGNSVPAEQALPVYLRNNVAKKSTKQRRGTS